MQKENEQKNESVIQKLEETVESYKSGKCQLSLS